MTYSIIRDTLIMTYLFYYKTNGQVNKKFIKIKNVTYFGMERL
jgi:hypothetical protein